MAKKHTANDDDEKIVKDNIQKRFKSMFTGKGQPLSNMSIQEVEALKARVSELEAQLVEQSGTAEKKVSSIVQETVSPSLSAKSAKKNKVKDAKPLAMNRRSFGLSEAKSPQARSAFLFAMLIAVPHFVAAAYYLYLFQTSSIAQFYTLAVISFALGILFVLGAVLSRRGKPTQGIILVLGALAVSYPPLTTLVSGLGIVIGLALMVVGPMSAFQVLPRRPGRVMTVITMVSGLATLLLDVFGSTARPSLPGIVIQLLAASVVGILGFSIVRQFRNYSLSTKLAIVVTFIFILIAAVQFQISSVRTHQQVEAEAEARLSGYYQTYIGRVTAESNAAGALAASIAARPDVQELYLKNDREGLYTLLLPTFEELKERQIVHLYIEKPDGTVFLRVHNPEKFGDDITYRGTAADALTLKEITSGIEMGPNRMGVRGIAPMYSGDRFIGMVEVGLDFDEQFIADLKALTGADFTMWVTYESAAVPNLKPAEGIPDAPIEELFYYASTSPQTLPVDPELFRSTLATGKPSFQAVTENTSTPSIVYITPLLGYKDKSFGLLEISTSYTESLDVLQASRITSLSVVAGLSLISLFLILITTSHFVLKPIESLAQFVNFQMSGDTSARVHLSSGDEFEQLANTFNSLANSVEDERKTLQQRVAERTHDLELASEVGRTATEKVMNLSEMLTEAAEMIRIRFDLYYTQIYLTDPAGERIVLRAGTGEVGKELLQRGHYLAINASSLNGRAVLEKQAQIVADTSENPSFLPNPLLPNTRSEMSMPLAVGGKVVGVLDMQSEQPGALSESNLPAFEALAGQLAIAIQNSALFTEVQEARAEAETQIRRFTELGWQEFLDAIHQGHRIGFAFDESQVIRLKSDELLSKSDDANSFRLPMTMTGTQIGEIQLPEQAKHTLTAGELELVQTTGAQLAQHIENLRLLAQAEQYREEAEQAVRRLTHEGWDSFLQTHTGIESGYMFDLTEVKPLSEKNGDSADYAVKQAMAVGDEIIGELAVNIPGQSEEAAEVLAAVARQLSGHIENLRLAELNEKHAQREKTLRQITSLLRSSNDPATIMRTAVRELGSIMGRRTVVQLVSPQQADQAQSTVSNENGSDAPAHQS